MPVLADDLAIAALVVGIGGLLLTAYDVCKDNPDAQFTKKLAMTYTVWQKDWVDRFKHMTNGKHQPQSYARPSSRTLPCLFSALLLDTPSLI